jgi:hypothetical protein
MRRFALLAVVLVAGCASSPRTDPRPDPGTPLATGEFVHFVSFGGNDSAENVRIGGRCAVYAEWVRIDSETGQFWIPRDSLSFIELKPE